FFFCQAEDGIRYDLVTGVQTCALPISFILDSHDQALKHTWSPSDIPQRLPSYCGYPKVHHSRINHFSSIRMNGTQERIHNRYKRSEERRVGKECRTTRRKHE